MGMVMRMEAVPHSDGATNSSAFVHVILMCYLAFSAMLQVVDAIVLGCVYLCVQHVQKAQTPTRCTLMLIGIVVCVAIAAATLLMGIVYLQLDMPMFPARASVLPVTVWLTVPSLLIP